MKDLETAHLLLRMNLGIKVRSYPQDDGHTLYHYQYPQIRNVQHTMLDEANALVLDEHQQLVSGTFPRIHDMLECSYVNLDWSRRPRLEMLETGLLVKIDMYKGKLLYTTKKGIGGNELLPGLSDGRRLSGALTMFLRSKFEGKKQSSVWYEGFSYVCMFVYPTEFSPYAYPDLYLLTIIDKVRGAEMALDFTSAWAEGQGLNRPVGCNVDNAPQAYKQATTMAHVYRGIVLRDHMNRRVLIRNPKYYNILTFTSNGKVCMESFAQCVLAEQHHKVGAYFHNYMPIFQLFEKTLIKARENLENFWEQHKSSTIVSIMRAARPHPLKDILALRAYDKIQGFDNIKEFITPGMFVILAANYYTNEYEKAYNTLAEEVDKNEIAEVKSRSVP